MSVRFGYVCTNYNNSGFSRGAVGSLAACGGQPPPIVIVDNNSDANNVRQLKEIAAQFPNVKLILGDDNVGYFKGLNKGIRYLKETYPEMEYVVIGNNDLLFPADFPEMLCRSLHTLERHAVLSPDIVTADGIHQNPHVIRSIGKVRELVYDLYYSNYLLAIAIAKLAKLTARMSDREDESHWQEARPIYQGHGSCYILGPMFFRYFDELWAPSFLMGEEFFAQHHLVEACRAMTVQAREVTV